MATYTITVSDGTTSSIAYDGHKVILSVADSKNKLAASIPNYSTITDIVVTGEFNGNLWGSDGNLNLMVCNASSTELVGDDTGVCYKIGGAIKSSNKWVSFTKSKSDSVSTTADGAAAKNSIIDFYNSGKKNVGEQLVLIPTQDVGLHLSFATLVPRKFSWRNVKAVFHYTPSTYTISLSSNNTNYGTVSGGGTWDVSTTAFSKTITATPKSGYKFVKWSDGNTSASRSITINENNITQTNTTLSLQAIFESDGINKIYVGNKQPTAIYVGNQPVKEIYVGNKLVYRK